MQSLSRPLMTRRHFIGTGAAAAGALALPLPARAITREAATGLVNQLVAEVNAVIASGANEATILAQFEVLFRRYADVPTIAGYVLGVERRNASAAQLTAWTQAYTTYVARKYGRRFREFEGGAIVVGEARDLPRGVEVQSTAVLQSRAPFRVDWHVEDSTGQPLFFNIVIEGINMLLSERTEILAQLDARGGDLDRLIAELPQG